MKIFRRDFAIILLFTKHKSIVLEFSLNRIPSKHKYLLRFLAYITGAVGQESKFLKNIYMFWKSTFYCILAPIEGLITSHSLDSIEYLEILQKSL